MRRDSAGVVAGEELDVEERTTRLPDPEDLEDPGWDDERELTEALDFENLAPWHTPEAEQAPDWALELTTSYDKPATQDPELEWDDDASLTRRFDPEPEPTSPARKQSVTESGTHPALRAPAATSGKAFAAESGAHPAPRARRVGAETLPARGRDAAGRARARNPLEPARWPLSAALTAEAAEYESPRLLQVAPPHAKGTRRASGVIATPAHEQRRALRPTRQTEKVWPAPPSALPEPASQATWRPPASSAAEVAAASTRPTWRPAALADGEPAGSPRPTLRPPALPASEVAPASARTTSRRPALRQSDASAALAAAAARTQPRRPTLRERVSGRAEQLETAAVTTALRPSPRGAADARTWAAAQPASARVFESLAPAERVQVPASRHLPAGLLWGAAGSVFVAVCVVIRVLAGGSSDIAPEPALAAPAVAANPADTGFTLVSRPAGAHVFVDGKSTGLITPARVRPLSPGLHAVELKLAGYYDTGLPAVLEPGLTVALGDVELRPLPVQEAAAAELAPRPRMRAASSERRSRPARRSRTASSLSSADLAAVSDARPTESSNAPLAAESGGTGLLQINSRPWARILVDGEFVGNTPQRRLPLSAGTHSVRLVNETLRMSKTFSVVIRAGETVTRVESLIEEPVQSGVVTHGRNVLAKLGR